MSCGHNELRQTVVAAVRMTTCLSGNATAGKVGPSEEEVLEKLTANHSNVTAKPAN
jgi:peptidyl-tRNA hydrolase